MPPTRAVNTGALFTRAVFTARVHGPWTRVEKTHPCPRAVNTAREHGSCEPAFSNRVFTRSSKHRADVEQ